MKNQKSIELSWKCIHFGIFLFILAKWDVINNYFKFFDIAILTSRNFKDTWQLFKDFQSKIFENPWHFLTVNSNRRDNSLDRRGNTPDRKGNSPERKGNSMDFLDRIKGIKARTDTGISRKGNSVPPIKMKSLENDEEEGNRMNYQIEF